MTARLPRVSDRMSRTVETSPGVRVRWLLKSLACAFAGAAAAYVVASVLYELVT